MTGPIGLHGGGEYVSGDEPFLDALLAAAARAAEHSASPPHDRIQIVVVPTAASRGLPDRAAATGVEAFERRAAAAGLPVRVHVARIVDAASAWDPDLAAEFVTADLIHLPGGDPDLIPAMLAGTAALAAIRHAWQRGAVLAGASAGAMALAEWTWTPRGGMHGLGFVRGLAVVPHYNEVRRTTWQASIDRVAPGGIGYLGLDERTGVLAGPNGSGDRQWVVAGPGAAWWFARDAAEPLVAHHGQTLRIPA
jgi:cyanophycinase